ncbi:MAG: nucleotidyltransferase family protein [Deltaproteobacteria bacterium]|nr:nucleotidyltransferase family protein [Deltaproteobacteria bacterium]
MKQRLMAAALGSVTVTPDATIREAMVAIDRSGLEVVLVCERDRKLLAMATDGDIRRALLRGETLESGVMTAANRNFTTVPVGVHRNEAVRTMLDGGFHCVPVVDGAGVLVDLHTLWVSLLAQDTGSWAVIMAGGRGERLGELTHAIPKPMLPVGDRPILERIVQLIVSHGIRRIFLSVNHMASMIEDHFGDGRRFHCRIEYLREREALGTAGALRLLPSMPTQPLLVMNGDLLTNVNLTRLFALHRTAQSAATVALRRHAMKIPYGVCKVESGRVVALEEKPELSYEINAGIYVVSPEALPLVPTSGPYSMTALLEACMHLGLPVGAYRMHESWQDIGLPSEFESAQRAGRD